MIDIYKDRKIRASTKKICANRKKTCMNKKTKKNS